MVRPMTKPKRKHKLTSDERHARFKALAHEVEAEGEAPDFDETVRRLAEQPKPPREQ